MTTRKSLDGKLYVGNPHVASMGLLMRICAAFLCAVFSLSLSAKTLYVDCNRVNDDGPGTSEANAFRTIQAAVTNAAINDTIIVLPGEYAEGSGGEGGTMGNARVYVSTYGLTIRSKEGKAVTHIVGAPDPETGGAGPNALKCVFIATSHVTVEGFTLGRPLNARSRVDALIASIAATSSRGFISAMHSSYSRTMRGSSATK